MKKTVLLLFFSFFSGISCFAQSSLSNIIQITEENDGFTLQFKLPEYDIIDTMLHNSFGIEEIFSIIQMEDLGIIFEEGYPQLPQLTTSLHIPDGAVNLTIQVVSRKTDEILIKNRIYPTLSIHNESKKRSVINEEYYKSKGEFFDFSCILSDPFTIFDEKGVNASIFPFQYNPREGKITVMKEGVFKIQYKNNKTKNIQKESNSTIKNSYLSKVFANYSSKQSALTKAGSSFIGNYLMITVPRFAETLMSFANYKQSLGYNVKVSIITPPVTSSTIRSIILGERPNVDFVLLVGDHEDLPIAAGDRSSEEIDDPPTDIDYVLFPDKDDLFVDAFIGRFSVKDSEELQTIINKTIYMEMNIHQMAKKAVLIAGDEECETWDLFCWEFFSKYEFKRAHKFAEKKVLTPMGYTTDILLQPNYDEVRASLASNPLVFVYSGHGGVTLLYGISFNLNGDGIDTAKNSVYPLALSFACRTGNFASPDQPSVGERWIRSSKGGIGFFASTVNTYMNSDVAIEKNIFEKGFSKAERTGEMLALGMIGYWNRFWSALNRVRTERYMRAYNYLGDPSFNFKGTGLGTCMNHWQIYFPEKYTDGETGTYSSANTIVSSAPLTIKYSAEVKFKSKRIVLKPGFETAPVYGGKFEAVIAPCSR